MITINGTVSATEGINERSQENDRQRVVNPKERCIPNHVVSHIYIHWIKIKK